MTTVLQFAERMAKAPTVMNSAERRMVNAAALAVTVAERSSLAAATHGTNRLRGVGRAGAKLGVGFDIKGTSNPTALVKARGPWQLIEGDTKPHTIAPKRRRGGRALAGKGFGPVARAQHPGTRGRHPWKKGLATGLPAATKAAQLEMQKVVAQVVGGK